MLKNVLKVLSVTVGVMVIYGCASTKDVEVRRYTEIRDRVDQEMSEGNAGYIAGTPQPEDRSDFRTTRKIYVLEVSKVPGEDEETVKVEQPDTEAAQDADMGDESYEKEPEFMIPPKESRAIEEETSVGMESQPLTAKPSAAQQYTIQKDDTLQKISKKFYDSYSKWPRIYDANRDVLDSPDKLKSGTVIQIPVD